MGSPFASSIFTQHEFTFDLPVGQPYRGDRGNITTDTVATKVKFYLKKASSRPTVLGAKVEYQPTHKAYVTAVDGVGTVNVSLMPNMVGVDDKGRSLRILSVSEESITPLTKLWGKVYMVEVSDRSILANN